MPTDDLVCHVLLRALGLRSEEGGDSLTGKDTANLTGARRGELLNDRGVLLAETTGVEVNRAVVPFEPPHTGERLLGRGEDGEYNESSLRLGEHHLD